MIIVAALSSPRSPFLPKSVIWEKGPKGERGQGDRGKSRAEKLRNSFGDTTPAWNVLKVPITTNFTQHLLLPF